MAEVCCGERTFQSIDAVLFDKDGTLAFVEDYLKRLGLMRASLIAQAAAEKGIDTPLMLEAAVLSALGLSKDRLDPSGLLAVGSRQSNEIAAADCLVDSGWSRMNAVEIVRSAFTEAAATLAPKVPHTPPLPHVHSLLRQLHAADVAVGIVSSDLHSEVTAFINHYRLPNIKWHCGFSAKTLPKTHPEFLQIVCKEMAVDADRILVVGDSMTDYGLSKQGAAGFLGMVGGWSEVPMLLDGITEISELHQIRVLD